MRRAADSSNSDYEADQANKEQQRLARHRQDDAGRYNRTHHKPDNHRGQKLHAAPLYLHSPSMQAFSSSGAFRTAQALPLRNGFERLKAVARTFSTRSQDLYGLPPDPAL